MLPLRLEIKNFLAYRSPEPLCFDGVHLACITGPNGAGKSSLLDAITWALWGKARAKRDEELVHLGQNDMYVQLDFEQEGTVYRVVRRRTRKSGGVGQLDLFIIDDAGLQTRSEPSTRATQQKINSLLRLDYDTFVNSAFLQQGKADAFTTKPPAHRKQILSDILGLDRWTAYEDTVKEQLKIIDRNIDGTDAQLRAIENDLEQEPALRQQLAEAEQAQREAKAALDLAEAQLREVEHAPVELRSAQERKASLERRVREHERDLQTIEHEIKDLQRRIAEFEEILNARVEIQEGYAVLQAAREADQTLGGKLFQLSDFDRQHRDLERQLEAARAELESEVRGCQAAIVQLRRTIDSARGDELHEVLAEVRALEDLEAQRDAFQEATLKLETERAELKGTNDKLRIEMNDIKARIDRLNTLSGATCPFCGQPLEEHHRAELIQDLRLDGTQRGDTFRGNQTRMDEITAQLAEHKQRLSELNQELKRLAARKEQAATLQAGVTAANEAMARLDEQQARLDVAQRALAENAYAEDIRVQLAELDEKRDALGYDSARHTAARQQLEVYAEFESRQQKLELAKAALPDVRRGLEGAQARHERAAKALADDRATLTDEQREIARLELLVNEFREREQEANTLRAAERNANNRLIVASQELKAMDTLRIRQSALQKQRDEKREQKALYEELRVAFSKNGIPAMIIDDAIPELETSANRILGRMTDGRMKLSMNTQREKVTGGVAETLDIQIADELGTRAYEMYSGGEAFRINFAIRVALSQLLARRAGAHLRTLFLDEGFGTQDEDGRNKLIEAITTVQDDFALILTITHIDELRDSFPVHIVLDKTSEGSRIAVR